MGRTKRAIDLAVRLLFIVLCFVLTYLFNALSNFSYGNTAAIDGTTEITVFADNGAEASYTLEDGKLILDISKAGNAYNDVSVSISIEGISFDTEYIKKSAGKKLEKHKDYLAALEAGPWWGNMQYRLTGDSMLADTDLSYIFIDAALDEHIEGVASKGANTKNTAGEFEFEPDDSTTAMFIMGTKEDGPLPAGKYYIDVSVVLSEPVDEAVGSFPADIKSSLMLDFIGDAVASTPVSSFFEISSIMTFYGMMIAFCLIFFSYQDLRSAFKIAKCASEFGATGQTITVTTRTFVNGVCTASSSYTYTDSGSLLRWILGFLVSYMLFLLLIPIRVVINIGKDIYHIICGDDNEEGFPLVGNLLGSIGIYALLFAVCGFMASWNIVISISALAVSIPLLIFAGKFCKEAEEYWD